MATEFRRHSFYDKQNKIKDFLYKGPKPQLNFQEKISNDSKAFLHKLKEKPHCLNPLSLRQLDCHPYEFELENFSPDRKFLTVKHEVPLFQPVSSTPLIMVDTKEDFEHLLQDLLSQTVIGVDLEHHDARSFQGITCVMQISTNKTDYIIDTLQLWDHMQPLNKVFCDPNILKIFQAAENDILWLQRDFGIYVVNLFDTCQAALLLGFQKQGLSFLLQHYCQVHVNKKYQLADWRIRPLPQEMIKYAREDTHYLIYIYERMKQDLSLRHCLGETLEMKKLTPKETKGRKSENKSSNIAPIKEKGVNLVLKVWENSRTVCLKRYRIPSNEEMYSKFYRTLTKKGFDNHESYALQELFLWRVRVAREEDESPHFVMPKDVMIKIVKHLPNEPEAILRCCPRSLFVRKHLLHLQEIFLKARSMTLTSNSTRKKTKNRNRVNENKRDKVKKSVGSASSAVATVSPVSRRPAKKRKIDDVKSSVKETRLVQKKSNLELIDLSSQPKRVKQRSPSKKIKMCKITLTNSTQQIDAVVASSSSGKEPRPVKKSRKIKLIDMT